MTTHLPFPYTTIQQDLSQAREFLNAGQEGKSRVCARKAAGKAARYWLERHDPQFPANLDPFQALIRFRDKIDAGDPLRVHVENLLRKVDQDHQLPAEIDLIASAKIMINKIKGEVS